jgi:hypothetical protein
MPQAAAVLLLLRGLLLLLLRCCPCRCICQLCGSCCCSTWAYA